MSGDAGGTAGDLLGSAVSTSSPTYLFKVKTPSCLSLTLETLALTEGRKAPSLGGDRAGYRCLQQLGFKVLSGEQEPKWESRAVPLGKDSWKASQNKGNLELSLGEWFSLGLRL